jgi:hypothetical protein
MLIMMQTKKKASSMGRGTMRRMKQASEILMILLFYQQEGKDLVND